MDERTDGGGAQYRPHIRPSSAGGQRMQFQKPTAEQLENRFNYHAPTGNQAQRYSRIRDECLKLARVIVDLTPCSPEQMRALNALDEVMMLANASIARNECATTN